MRSTLWTRLLAAALLVCALLAPAPCGAQETEGRHHYLLLGLDTYADDITDNARTDTMMLVTLDETYDRIILTSILRDTKIPNPSGNDTKINLLYKHYGIEGVTQVLERELEIEISGTVLINYESVKDLIDALGGVDIEITQNEANTISSILLNDDPNLPEGAGLAHMTGRIALAYMRNRWDTLDGSSGGDFSRTERQRKVLTQLLDKCRNLSLSELSDVYNAISDGVETDMTALELLTAIQHGYGLLQAQLCEYRIPADGTYRYGELNGSSVLSANWTRNKEYFHEMLDTPPEV